MVFEKLVVARYAIKLQS